jgi:serine protease
LKIISRNHLKKEGQKMKAKNQILSAGLIAAGLMTLSFDSQAQGSKRYLVVYKSELGFHSMDSFMQQESSRGYGLQRSLKSVQAQVIKTNNPRVVEQLAKHPEVAVVEEERFIPAPKPVNAIGFSLASVGQSLRPLTASTQDDAVQTTALDFKQGEKTPWGILAVNAPQAWAKSDGGSKARVLVLDTGIDRDHPALKANFEEGRNFFDSDTGLDPNDYLDQQGHGTHCSGTIAAAYNPETGFTGVAPKAKLLMGRVCGDLGCSNIAVVNGINWGIEKRVDVISMSLGGPIGSVGERLAVQNAEKAGVVVVAASGNDGTAKVSFPAAFPTVFAVGAVGSDLVKTGFSQWGPELDIVAPGAAVLSSVPRGSGRDSSTTVSLNGVKRRIVSVAFGGTKEIVTPKFGELVPAGLGKPDEIAKVDLKGKFALIVRGEIRFSEKVANAVKAGATGVVIYNNAPGLVQGSITDDGSELDLAVVMIEQTEGVKLVDAIKAGTKVSAEVVTERSDYAVFDGTSMATPHVAGVVALLKSANKSLTPAQVRSLLSSTAKPLGPNDANQYGAGLVQADKAVQAASNP